MQQIVRIIRDSQLARHNAVFFAGAMAVGALNYAYYPVLARLVTPDTFGEIQTLASLFLQSGVLLAALSMVIVGITTSGKDDGTRNKLIFELEKFAVIACGVLCTVVVIFSRQLQELLRFEQAAPFAVLGLALVASVPLYVRGAFLRGRQRFGLVSAGNIAAAGGKLLLSAALVIAGLGTLGAVGGIFAAQLAACVLVGWWAYRHGLRHTENRKALRLPDTKMLAPELRYSGVVLVASLAITLQYSIDVILVKYYFDPTTAGLYAGMAAVARIPFFLTASVAQVLMSKVRPQAGHAQNRRVLKQSILILLGLCVPTLAAFAFLPDLITRILIGNAYGAMANLLPMLAASVFIVAVLNLLVAYYLSLRRYGIAVLTAVGALFTYLFIFLHHGSPAAVVESLLLGSAVTLAAVGVWQLTERRSGARE